jgi:hypothetical protein
MANNFQSTSRRKLSNEIPAGFLLRRRTGNPHPPQPRPVQPQDRPAKGLRAFRCMGVSGTRRTASPILTACPPWPRGQGGRPALRTAPCLRARERATRAESQYRKRYVLHSSGRVSWKRQMLPKPDPVLPDYYYHGSQLALLLNRWGAWAP